MAPASRSSSRGAYRSQADGSGGGASGSYTKPQQPILHLQRPCSAATSRMTRPQSAPHHARHGRAGPRPSSQDKASEVRRALMTPMTAVKNQMPACSSDVLAPSPGPRRARPISAKAQKHRRVVDDDLECIIYEDTSEGPEVSELLERISHRTHAPVTVANDSAPDMPAAATSARPRPPSASDSAHAGAGRNGSAGRRPGRRNGHSRASSTSALSKSSRGSGLAMTAAELAESLASSAAATYGGSDCSSAQLAEVSVDGGDTVDDITFAPSTSAMFTSLARPPKPRP